MVPWFVILLSELRFRRQNQEAMADHPFKMPLYPLSNYIAIIFLVLIVVFMFINPETRVSVTVGAVFLLLLSGHYMLTRRRSSRAD